MTDHPTQNQSQNLAGLAQCASEFLAGGQSAGNAAQAAQETHQAQTARLQAVRNQAQSQAQGNLQAQTSAVNARYKTALDSYRQVQEHYQSTARDLSESFANQPAWQSRAETAPKAFDAIMPEADSAKQYADYIQRDMQRIQQIHLQKRKAQRRKQILVASAFGLLIWILFFSINRYIGTQNANATATAQQVSANATATVRQVSVNATATVRQVSVNATTAKQVSINATATVRQVSVNATTAKQVSINATATVRQASVNATATVRQASVNATATAQQASVNAMANALGIEPEHIQVRPVDDMLMVYVSAGEFEMGSNNGYDDEKPVHTVYLDAYWIDQTEVTNAQFAEFIRASDYRTDAEKDGASFLFNPLKTEWKDTADVNWQYPQGKNKGTWQSLGLAQHPVVHVSWNDAQAYCDWAGVQLLSEAQWEKAARGTDGRIYPWGEQAPNGKYLDFADKNLAVARADKSADDGYQFTAPVGSYPDGASPYGALDMAGNVWEWVADWHGEQYYQNSPARNPQGPGSGDRHVLRGGSWYNYSYTVRAPNRGRGVPSASNDNIGFRCSTTAP